MAYGPLGRRNEKWTNRSVGHLWLSDQCLRITGGRGPTPVVVAHIDLRGTHGSGHVGGHLG